MFLQYRVYWGFLAKGCWILLKALYWDDHVVFFFGSVYVVDYIYKLVYTEPTLHPQDEAYLVMMDKLFDVLLQSVCQ